MTKRIRYIGLETGDNMALTPEHVLDIIRSDLPDLNESETPVKGLLAMLILEDQDGTLHLRTYRAQLPRIVEVAVIARQCWLTMRGHQDE